MLQFSGIYLDRNVLSLRTGGMIGHVHTPVINPDNLKVEGWLATAKGEKQLMILPVGEVRDIIASGIVVNDHDSLTDPDDLIRLKKILEFNYQLLNKHVLTESKKRLGKVQDYAVDDKSMYIQKLYVNQPMFKGFSLKQMVIDRSQIVEITNKKIIVKDSYEKVPSGSPATVSAL